MIYHNFRGYFSLSHWETELAPFSTEHLGITMEA
jgi:hypothetical protein